MRTGHCSWEPVTCFSAMDDWLTDWTCHLMYNRFSDVERISAFAYLAIEANSGSKVFTKLTRTHNAEVHSRLAGIALLLASRCTSNGVQWGHSTIVVHLPVASNMWKTKLSTKCCRERSCISDSWCWNVEVSNSLALSITTPSWKDCLIGSRL